MDFQNSIPLEAMEGLEAKYGIELHLVQTPSTNTFYYKRNTNWFYIGHTIQECEIKLEKLYKEGKL